MDLEPAVVVNPRNCQIQLSKRAMPIDCKWRGEREGDLLARQIRQSIHPGNLLTDRPLVDIPILQLRQMIQIINTEPICALLISKVVQVLADFRAVDNVLHLHADFKKIFFLDVGVVGGDVSSGGGLVVGGVGRRGVETGLGECAFVAGGLGAAGGGGGGDL